MTAENGGTPAPEIPATRLLRVAAWVPLLVTIFLIAIKAWVWFLTDSVSILGSLIDSMFDGVAALTTLVTITYALVPADREHRFGHGKMEALGALAQAAFVAGATGVLLFEIADHLLDPQPVRAYKAGIAVMLVSIVTTLGLVGFMHIAAKRSGSIGISAASLHFKGDLLLNSAVIAALVLNATFGWIYADPVFGIGIVVYLAWNSYAIARLAINMLMDRELPDTDRDAIRRIALEHAHVDDVHDLRTRRSGQVTFVQMHLEMNGEMSLLQAHRTADEVEDAIMAVFPGAEIIIHQDPTGLETAPPLGH